MVTPTIGLVDNDDWALLAMKQWIHGHSRACTLLWVTNSSSQALYNCLYSQMCPDVLIIDMALGSSSGPEICRSIRKASAHPSVLGITANDPTHYVHDLSKAGAQGLIAKKDIPILLPDLIQPLAHGKSIQSSNFLSASEAHQRLCGSETSKSQPFTALSKREIQILSMYASGKTTDEIVKTLGLSSNSVYTFINRAAHKLGVVSRAEAIRKGREYDLL